MSTRKNQKTGRWEVEFQYRGQRIHRLLPAGKKKEDADLLERKLRSQIFDTKDLGHEPEHTIGEAIMRYRREYTGKAFPESHARALGRYVTGRMLSELVAVSARVARDSAISGSTKNRRLAILRRVAHLSYRRWGWLQEPLHQKIEMLPENPAREVYLSRDELAGLIRRIRKGRYKNGRQARMAREMARAVLGLAFTGLRLGELMILKPDNICGTTIRLNDPRHIKNGKPRNVPILKDVRFVFKRLPFSFDPTSLSHAVARASGNKVRVHDLRHTCASFLVQASIPLWTVAQILGNPSAVKRYAHLDVKHLEAAISTLSPKRKPKAKVA